jgi:hypothetical protein
VLTNACVWHVQAHGRRRSDPDRGAQYFSFALTTPGAALRCHTGARILEQLDRRRPKPFGFGQPLSSVIADRAIL